MWIPSLKVTGDLKAGVRYICTPETEYRDLQAENKRLRERIQKLYAGSLSPESRLNGYKVICDTIKRKKYWYKQALETIVEMKNSAILQDIIDVAEQALQVKDDNRKN